MNNYQEKLERKKDRYRDLAKKNKEQSNSLFLENKGVLDAMNGQPILIGHHSEKRHRRELETLRSMDCKDIECEKFTFIHDKEENRFVFEFPGKPDDNSRRVIKSYGFKWSRYRMAWVRKITPNAFYAKERLVRQLTGMEIQFS